MLKSEKSRKIIIIASVVALLCLAAAFIMYNAESKQTKISKLKLDIVKTALEKYNLEKKQYPASLEILQKSGYVSGEDLLDLWGSPYVYVPCGKESGKTTFVVTYMLSSAGKDKKAWTKDDIQ